MDRALHWRLMSEPPAPAETIGSYVIERSLAQGSMGHVYVARHKLTYACVALKVLRSELTADAHAEERFLREVRAAAQIGHEGIVKVLDAGCDAQGRLYLAMELLSGETLEDRIAREPNRRLALMRWIASALPPLSAAHAHSIVHRDLKPANLFIARSADGDEQLKLLDFGLARDTRQKSRTETGIALGTPYYMSPEQAMRPKEVGPASDVWALGVMMYEVLSGQMPFDGETLHAVVLQSTTQPHVPLATRRPALDAALCELVEDCLNKQPGSRPRDASALLDRLLPLLEDEQICRQLEEPLTAPRAAHAYGSHHSGEQFSYADTAMTLPAPRIDESEASYALRRRASGSVATPLVISALVLGAGAFGYVRYAPDVRTNAGQATLAPPMAAPTALQQTASAAAPTQLATAPADNTLLPSLPSLPERAPEIESQASAARDAHGHRPAAARPRSTSKPGHESTDTDTPEELPLPDAPSEVTDSALGPAAASNESGAPVPTVPDTEVSWDQIDAQLQANAAHAAGLDDEPPAPTEPSADAADAPGDEEPPGPATEPPAEPTEPESETPAGPAESHIDPITAGEPHAAPSAPEPQAAQEAGKKAPGPEQMPTPIARERDEDAPRAPAPEVESLPPPEPPARP